MRERYRVKIAIKRLTKRKDEHTRPGFDVTEEVVAESFTEAFDFASKVASVIVDGLDERGEHGRTP